MASFSFNFAFNFFFTESEEEKKSFAEQNTPYFAIRLTDTEVMENTFLRFMVKVIGEPRPKIQLYVMSNPTHPTSLLCRNLFFFFSSNHFSYKDGNLIDTADSHIQINSEKDYLGFYELIIPEVKYSDAGKYSCTATNKYGSASCEASVTVCEDKNVFGENFGKILPAGEQPIFKWKRNGIDFDPEERFKVILGDDEDSLALLFQHVKPEDAGIYTCCAQTSTGNIACSAELTVQGSVQQLIREPEKPQLIIEHKEASASIGATAMIELQYKGYPKPKVEWKHDGEVIEAGGKYKFLYEDAESMSLVIKGVQSEDAGFYSVSARNELGEDSGVINLQIKSGPILQKLDDFTCMAGDRLVMDVEVEGNPMPTIKILHNGKELSGSDRIIITRGEEINQRCVYTVEFKRAELSDAGAYTIIASNEINQTSEFWNLTVNSPPTIIKRLEREYIHGEREEIIMSMRADAYPEPEVKWYKEGTEINEKNDARIRFSRDGNAYIMIITGAVRTDASKYSVELNNEHGKHREDTTVRIKCSPDFKTKMKSITVSEGDTNVELFVAIQGYPK